MTVSDGGAGATRRDGNADGFENAFVAASRGAQPERTHVTVSDGGAGAMRRDQSADDDAAAVIAVIAALAARASGSGMTPPLPRSVWNAAPARAAALPGPHAWWASGLPR